MRRHRQKRNRFFKERKYAGYYTQERQGRGQNNPTHPMNEPVHISRKPMIDKPIVPDYLNNVRVVLVRTSHPANIGAAARAMKTMGLSQLTLVSPNIISTPMTPEPPVFDKTDVQSFRLPEESFILATGAANLLENANIVSTLDEALAETVLSCALTSRRRELTAQLKTPRQLMPELLQAARAGQQVALVFGNETFGLNIEEVQSCNRLMTINGNPDFFSLNLAQAVQVVCYELFSQLDQSLDFLIQEDHPATHEQIVGLVGHLESVMDDIGFFDRRNSERMMRRMQGLFSSANTQTEDIDILRGFLSTAKRKLNHNKE